MDERMIPPSGEPSQADNRITLTGNEAPQNLTPEDRRDDELIRWALEQMEDSKDVMSRQRKDMRDTDRFNAGQHFDKSDQEKMEAEQRPTASFNVAQKFIRFVGGLERRSRQEIAYIPREITDEKQQIIGELVTKVHNWVLQNCNGDEERSRAFEDLLVRGMGWTDTYLDRSVDMNGEIKLIRVDAHEMWWDSNATRQNLEDARWICRERQIHKKIAMKRWPHAAGSIEAAAGQRAGAGREPEESFLYSMVSAKPQSGLDWPSVKKDHVLIYEFQWYDEVPGVFFVDPANGKEDWLVESDFDKYRTRFKKLYSKMPGMPQDIDGDRLLMRQYKRMLFCNRVMLAGPLPLPGKRFSFNAMTGQWDEEKKVWYGYFRLLMDPQRYLTKFVNQVMEIITKTAKGGLIAEVDAFQNLMVAEQTYARTGSITWVNPGALQQKKIEAKPMPVLPQGSIEMFRVCTDMLKEVTGVAPEVSMGMGMSDVPATTMRQRQLASIALLAREFSALERYRIAEARTIFDFLQFIADNRIIRVGGQYDSQALKLIRDPFLLDYDVVLEDSTRDPNIREQYLASIMQIAPTLIRTNNFIPELLDFFPLPASVRTKIKQGMMMQAQMQAQMSGQKGRGKQTDPQETQAKVQKLQADAMYTQTKAALLVEQMHQGKMKQTLQAIVESEKSRREDEKLKAENARSAIESMKVATDAQANLIQSALPQTGSQESRS